MEIRDTAHAATKELVFSLGLFAVARHFQLSKMHVVAFAALAYTRTPEQSAITGSGSPPWAYGVANAIKAYTDLTLVVGTLRLMSQFRSLSGLWKAATVVGAGASTLWTIARLADVYQAASRGSPGDGPLNAMIANQIDCGCFKSKAKKEVFAMV